MNVDNLLKNLGKILFASHEESKGIRVVLREHELGMSRTIFRRRVPADGPGAPLILLEHVERIFNV